MRMILSSKLSRKRPSKSHDQRLPIGSSFCRCAGECGQYFRSERAFERHRIGDFGPSVGRGCAPTARMPELGLCCTSGIWHLSAKPFSADKRRLLEAA